MSANTSNTSEDMPTVASVVVNSIIVALSTCGILCNCLTVLVLTCTKLKRHSSYTYLTGLAMIDGLYLVCILPNSLVRALLYSGALQCVGYWSCVIISDVLLPMGNTTAALSTWIIAIVSIERFIFTKFPVQSKVYCTPKTSWTVLGICTVACVLFHIPYFLIRKPEQDEKYCWIAGHTEFSRSSAYAVYRWCRVGMVQVLPWLAVVTFNTLLLINLHRSRKANRKNVETKLTIMIVVVIFESLLLDLVTTFTNHGINTEDIRTREIMVLTENMTETVRACANFVLYCCLNKNFANEVKGICPCKVLRVQPTDGNRPTNSAVAAPKTSNDTPTTHSTAQQRSSTNTDGSSRKDSLQIPGLASQNVSTRNNLKHIFKLEVHDQVGQVN